MAGQEFYSKFGSKIGTGAAKLGKKAAESEAGRSAGKAAIRGATEGARQDLTDRCLKQGEYSGSHGTPGSPKEPKTSSQSFHSKFSSGGTANRSHEESDFYSNFGSKIGTGAAKLGKKAAESEAGRSAGKAAIHGATEGARQDLTDRYLKQGEYSGSHGTPGSPKAPKTSSQPFHSKFSSGGTAHHSSSSGGGHSSTHSSRESHPPKPSIFSKLTGHSKPPPQRKAAPIQRDPKDRVYSHRLAKEPDWDRLTMAQALYNFKGEMKCDLEFRKGQVIKIITRTDKQFDWWEGKIDDRVGIFPANFVKVL